eukprot:jgi/Psemu1/307204/fgenesh1_kg.311_\
MCSRRRSARAIQSMVAGAAHKKMMLAFLVSSTFIVLSNSTVITPSTLKRNHTGSIRSSADISDGANSGILGKWSTANESIDAPVYKKCHPNGEGESGCGPGESCTKLSDKTHHSIRKEGGSLNRRPENKKRDRPGKDDDGNETWYCLPSAENEDPFDEVRGIIDFFTTRAAMPRV